MVNTMIILTAFLFFLFIRNIRNIYAWIFILMITGLVLCIFSILIFVSKTSSYKIFSLFMFDHKLFLLFSSIKINYFWIFRILNIGIALYLTSVPLFVFRYTKPHYYLHRPNHLIKTALAFLPPLFFILYYDPLTSYHFYLLFQRSLLETRNLLRVMLNIVDYLNYAWIIAFLIYPLVILFRNYFRSRAVFFRKRNLTFIICFVVMNTFFFTMFFTNPFRGLYIYSSNFQGSFVKHIVAMETPSYYYNVLPLIMLIALSIMGFMLMKNRGLGTIDIFRKVFIEKNIIELNRYFRGFLHGFKNTFFKIKILADKAEDLVTKEAVEPVKQITCIASETIESISRTLTSLKDISVSPKKNNLRDCVEEALSEVEIEKTNIVIKKRYDGYQQTYAYFDFYLLKTAFHNILQNAVESIRTKDEGIGAIEIGIFCQSRLIVVTITDNGIGIKRKDTRKIFKMFYTTKTRQKNWGAGLSLVSNIIKKHLGIINVYSKYRKYAKFEIVINKIWADRDTKGTEILGCNGTK